MSSLPTGTVTYLFTDIEGSTRLLGALGDRYAALLEDHHRVMREALAEGVEVMTEGDAFFCAFTSAPAAVRAAVEAQRRLAAHDWPEGHAVRVRIGMHTGEAVLGGDNYSGIDVNRAARISATGHGGQIVISEATRALAAGIPGVSFRDLGEHRLKDLPSPERLFQVVADGLETEFPAIRSLDSRPGNLPAPMTSFIGREREIEEVKELLRGSRLLTLIGPGGAGKTRLSLRVAGDVQDDFADGAFFVALAPISDPGLVATTIAQSVGLREDPARSPLETLVEHVRDKELLLVLDNWEQILDAAGVVAEVLAVGEGITVLATSREPLHLDGEREYAVPPLGLPDIDHLPALGALSQFAAVRLFIERASAVKPGFEVTNENAPAVAEITARLDGLPLAIELAAARVKLLPPDAILKRLDNTLSLLAGGARNLPARQQTLRGAVAWSYELLDEAERRLFTRLAVFVRGFTLEAAEAVATPELGLDALDGVASLVDKSLVRQSDEGEGRFYLLQTIREYALEKLAESDERDEIKRRHAAYFLGIVERNAAELFGPKQAELLDELSHEHDNLRAALIAAAELGDVETALRLGGALWRFWQMRGHLVEAAERLAALLQLPDADRHPEALAIALEGAGGVFYWRADWDRAQEYYERCLELRRALGDEAAVGEALYNLSFLFTVPPPPRQDLDRGRDILAEAHAIYQRLADRRGIAQVAWAMANTFTLSSRWEEAKATSEEASTLFRELDDRFGLGWALHGVGLAATWLRRFDEALAALTESLQLFTAVGDVTGIGLVLNDFALLEGMRGDHVRATRLYGAAVAAESRSGQALVTNFSGLYPEWLASVRGDLSDQEDERFRAEGAAMSEEEAVSYALGREGHPPA